jgi:general secretion pathway protein K
LLAVLWLTAALSAIAFSIADTVRSETERAVTQQETTRAYYLARGAVERALFMLRNDESGMGGSPAERFVGRRRMYFQEQTGDTLVELISERGKLPLRTLTPTLLLSLLSAMGEPAASATAIVNQAYYGGGGLSLPFSQNSQSASAFRPSFASMENVEELLLVPGITPEIVYGRFNRLPDGNLVNVGGLIDFLSPHVKPGEGLDPFSVHPTVLVSMGMSPGEARTFAEGRRSVFNPNAALAAMGGGGVSMRSGLGDIFQIRATGRPRLPNGRLSEARRTVALLIKFVPPNPRYMWISPWTHLRWYDQTFSDVASSNAVWMSEPAQGMRQ